MWLFGVRVGTVYSLAMAGSTNFSETQAVEATPARRFSLLFQVAKVAARGFGRTMAEDVIGAITIGIGLVTLVFVIVLAVRGKGDWGAAEEASWVFWGVLSFQWIRAISIVWRDIKRRPQIIEVESGLYLPNGQRQRRLVSQESPRYFRLKLVITGVLFNAMLAGAGFGVHMLLARIHAFVLFVPFDVHDDNQTVFEIVPSWKTLSNVEIDLLDSTCNIALVGTQRMKECSKSFILPEVNPNSSRKAYTWTKPTPYKGPILDMYVLSITPPEAESVEEDIDIDRGSGYVRIRLYDMHQKMLFSCEDPGRGQPPTKKLRCNFL